MALNWSNSLKASLTFATEFTKVSLILMSQAWRSRERQLEIRAPGVERELARCREVAFDAARGTLYAGGLHRVDLGAAEGLWAVHLGDDPLPWRESPGWPRPEVTWTPRSGAWRTPSGT